MVNNKRDMETKPGEKLAAEILGAVYIRHLLHVHSVFSCLQSPCTISWRLIFALKTFRWDWLLILFKKGHLHSSCLSASAHREGISGSGAGAGGCEQPYTPCYMVKFANQNFILPKINYIIGKFYLLREEKNFRDSSPGSLIPLALVLGSALWGRTWWSSSADLIPKRLRRQREKTRDLQHPNAFH